MNESFSKIAEEYSHNIWNVKNLLAADQWLHPDIVIHSLLGDHIGIDAMKQVITGWLTGLPDLVVKHKQIISEKNTVVIHWDAEGTHKGIFKGISPTRKKVRYSGVSIYLFDEGKIKEYWGYLDMQHLLRQMNS